MTGTCNTYGLHLNLMPRNMDMSNFDERKPPLPKGRGTTEGGGGIQKRDFVNKKIPQSASQTVFDPGRNYKLLPALAKNMPRAYFLYASRPLGKRAFERFASKTYMSQFR